MKRDGWKDTITGYAGFAGSAGDAGHRFVRAALPLLAALALLFAAAPPAQSQAVQGLRSVQGLRTERFDIYYPASLEAEGRRLAGFADAVYADLEAFFSPAAAGAGGGTGIGTGSSGALPKPSHAR